MTDRKGEIEPTEVDDSEPFEERVLIPGIGIGGYRSFRELQRLSPLRQVTLVAGQNNAGKSNVLRFLKLLGSGGIDSLQWSDDPQPVGPALRYELAHRPPTKALIRSRYANPGPWVDQLWAALGEPCFRPDGSDLIWIPYEAVKPGVTRRWDLDKAWLHRVAFETIDFQPAFREAARAATTSGSSPLDHVRSVVEHLFPGTTPAVSLIGPFRQVLDSAPGEKAHSEIDGTDLIKRLAVLQHDSTQNYRQSRARFDAIVEFARNVFADESINISIPDKKDELQIHQQGRVLSLASLGSGIQQVLIIAAAATTIEKSLVCIEEPELHLHPVLQRKLIRYLTQHTSNQYVIATHSAHMLDYESAAVMALRLDQASGTLVKPATTAQQVSDLCNDLGYRPSDLIQANAVIWVEGPSDRIYLRKWIELVAPDEFVEGIHYTIMFYGGSLLSHLTGTDPGPGTWATAGAELEVEDEQDLDPDVDDFISLRRLNRHSMILIDSDRTSENAEINESKRRVQREFDDDALPGHAWITSCRTIENYVPDPTLTAAVRSVHRARQNSTATMTYIYEPPATEWDDPLIIVKTVSPKATRGADATTSRVAARKVEIAKAATQVWPDSTMPLDLECQVKQVVAFLRRANEGDPDLQ